VVGCLGIMPWTPTSTATDKGADRPELAKASAHSQDLAAIELLARLRGDLPASADSMAMTDSGAGPGIKQRSS
jgi:hypothetical protein